MNDESTGTMERTWDLELTRADFEAMMLVITTVTLDQVRIAVMNNASAGGTTSLESVTDMYNKVKAAFGEMSSEVLEVLEAELEGLEEPKT